MVLAELSLFPLDKGVHLSDHVAKAVGAIKDAGLSYQLTAMGTLIEGEWDQVMGVVDKCFHTLEAESDRVYLTLKVDAKKGKHNQLHEKVEHVEAKL